MSYSQFKSSSKALITADQIGPGQINTSHLDPALFSEIRNIAQHSHSGVRSRKLDPASIEGIFGSRGIYLYSQDGSKKYEIQVNNSGVLVISEVT